MPELPEVETIVRGLRPRLEGRRLARVVQRRDDLRFPLPPRFAERLTGRRVESIGRRAKYILVHLDQGEVLLCHLGMSGSMVLVDQPNQPLARHDHIVFTTEDGCEVRFNDARRFGAMDLIDAARLDQHWLLKDLGPEPLGNGFNGPILAEKLAGKRTPIKAALLDQKVVAGLGNIYVCEALWRAKLMPDRAAATG
jgi:formamidopyrimidine-DNA glycosylase